jgi:hypothetical protein
MFIYLVKDLLYGDVVLFYRLNSTYFPWLLLTATSIDRDQVFVGVSRNAPRNAGYRFLGFLWFWCPSVFYVFRVKLASIMVESFPIIATSCDSNPVRRWMYVCMGIELHLMMHSWEVMKVNWGCYVSWCHSQYHYIIAVGGPWTCMQSGECCYCSNHSSVFSCNFKDCVSSFSWFAAIVLCCYVHPL